MFVRNGVCSTQQQRAVSLLWGQSTMSPTFPVSEQDESIGPESEIVIWFSGLKMNL